MNTAGRKTQVNKTPAAPSCYKGSASTCLPQLADADFKQNGELLRTSRNVPKNTSGIGLWRQQSAVNRPVYNYKAKLPQIKQ